MYNSEYIKFFILNLNKFYIFDKILKTDN